MLFNYQTIIGECSQLNKGQVEPFTGSVPVTLLPQRDLKTTPETKCIEWNGSENLTIPSNISLLPSNGRTPELVKVQVPGGNNRLEKFNENVTFAELTMFQDLPLSWQDVIELV